jgi:hypothetical protein
VGEVPGKDERGVGEEARKAGEAAGGAKGGAGAAEARARARERELDLSNKLWWSHDPP